MRFPTGGLIKNTKFRYAENGAPFLKSAKKIKFVRC